MIDAARSCAVVAFIDELDADARLLAAWNQTFSGSDPVTLVIHPGSWTAEQVSAGVGSIVESAGIADDQESVHLVALTGPLSAVDDQRLAARCAAVYGNAPAAGPLLELPRLGPAGLDQLRASLPARRTLTRERQIATINGSWTVVHRGTNADISVLEQIFRDKSYSLERMTSWPGIGRYANAIALAGAPPLIVDAGANLGASCVYFSIMFPEATIVAIEPEADNFQVLTENAAQHSRIRPLQKAIAAHPGVVPICDPGIGFWGFRAGAGIGAGTSLGEVPAISIDDAIEAGEGAIPFILKIDIEGAEGDLFTARHESLARFPIVIVELHDWMIPEQETSRSFLSWHLAQGRDLMSIGENLFSLSPALRDPSCAVG